MRVGEGVRGHLCHWEHLVVSSGRVRMLDSLDQKNQGAGAWEDILGG